MADKTEKTNVKVDYNLKEKEKKNSTNKSMK